MGRTGLAGAEGGMLGHVSCLPFSVPFPCVKIPACLPKLILYRQCSLTGARISSHPPRPYIALQRNTFLLISQWGYLLSWSGREPTFHLFPYEMDSVFWVPLSLRSVVLLLLLVTI